MLYSLATKSKAFLVASLCDCPAFILAVILPCTYAATASLNFCWVAVSVESAIPGPATTPVAANNAAVASIPDIPPAAVIVEFTIAAASVPSIRVNTACPSEAVINFARVGLDTTARESSSVVTPAAALDISAIAVPIPLALKICIAASPLTTADLRSAVCTPSIFSRMPFSMYACNSSGVSGAGVSFSGAAAISVWRTKAAESAAVCASAASWVALSAAVLSEITLSAAVLSEITLSAAACSAAACSAVTRSSST